MTKVIAVLSLAAVLTVAAPRDVLAGPCTDAYSRCIAEAGLLSEPFRSMADVECGAGYVGCVARALKFW
jgi:hypothetical protein